VSVRFFAALLLGLSVIVSLGASKPADDVDEIERAKLLGVLVYTKVSMKMDDTPARDAIKALREALGVAVVGRWSDDALGFGMDPNVRLTLELHNVDGLSALEQILEQAAVAEECTWQLRKGFIEVGTKERLSMPATREVRVYPIRDFMLEPPRFGRLSGPVGEPKLQKYGGAMIGTPASTVVNGKESVRRKEPEDLALEMVEAIVETVEPGRWNTGEEDDDGRSVIDSQMSSKRPSSPPTTQPASSGAFPPIEWASIRLWRDQLIVKAPDFMHRQINGYPKPIPPKPASSEDTARP
jgi:hypothetical protein